MQLAAGHSWRPDAGFGRWGAALATVLVLHAGAAVGSMIARESTDPPAPPPAAIMLELAPLPAAPPAAQTAAPPEPQPEPEPEPPVDLSQLLPPIPELPPTPPDIPVPEVALPKPTPKPEKKQAETPKPASKKEEPRREKPPKPKEKPRPEPEPAVTQKPAPQPAQKQEAAVAAPVQPAAKPSAPSAADVARRAAAEANWQGMLLAHLERHKKYPRLARKRHAEGTAYLRFRMDRSGQVLSFALARSAGHEVLDEEVLAMIQRAEPLPALPPEVTEGEVEIVVPVQFTLR